MAVMACNWDAPSKLTLMVCYDAVNGDKFRRPDRAEMRWNIRT